MAEATNCDAGLAADYESLLDFLYLTPIGIVKFRPNGQIVMTNPMAVQLLMPLSLTADMPDLFDLFSGFVPNLRELITQFKEPSGPVFNQLQINIPATRMVLRLDVNRISADVLMAVIQDITLMVEQEKRIHDDQQRFRVIFENIRGCAICTVDLEAHVDGWNRSLNHLGGWEPADVVDKSVGALFSPEGDDRLDYLGLLDRAKRLGSAEAEGWAVRKDRTKFWGHAIGTVVLDSDARPTGYIVATRDLSERKAAEDRLIALATTDPLTGASNRRAGETRLEEAFGLWQRYQRPFTLLMIDCDHFKAVNDTWGHKAGDEVLIALVRLCRETLRGTDVIIRWGGEEFLLLLPETHCEKAFLVAGRLRMAIEATKIHHEGHTIPVTVSIGVAEAGETDTCTHDILSRADRALYRAKSTGRNRIETG